MKRFLIFLLLAIPFAVKAQYVPPTGGSPMLSMQGFYKVSGSDTTTWLRAANGLYFPVSSGGNFIRNGTSLQTANFNVSGIGRIGDSLLVRGVTRSTGVIQSVANIARGTIIEDTLKAASNSALLIGLDINPGFNDNGHTSVRHMAVKASGSVSPGLDNAYTLGNIFVPGAVQYIWKNAYTYGVESPHNLTLKVDTGNIYLKGIPDTSAGYKAVVITADGRVQTAPYGGGGGSDSTLYKTDGTISDPLGRMVTISNSSILQFATPKLSGDSVYVGIDNTGFYAYRHSTIGGTSNLDDEIYAGIGNTALLSTDNTTGNNSTVTTASGDGTGAEMASQNAVNGNTSTISTFINGFSHSSNAIIEAFNGTLGAAKQIGMNSGDVIGEEPGIYIINHVDSTGMHYSDAATVAKIGTDTLQIPHIGWVERYVADHATTTVTTGNGISGDGSSGTPVILGGNLTAATTINAGTQDFQMQSASGLNVASLRMFNGTLTGSVSRSSHGSATLSMSISGSDPQAGLNYTDNAGTGVKGVSVGIGHIGIYTTDSKSSLGYLYAGDYGTNQRANRESVPSVRTVIALADSVKGTISSVSLADPSGLLTFTASNGSAVTALRSDGLHKIDSTVVASVANHPTLAQLQTALNLKANLASPTFTGTVTIPNGGVFGTPTSINIANATGMTSGQVTTALGFTPIAPSDTTTAFANLVHINKAETILGLKRFTAGKIAVGVAPTRGGQEISLNNTDFTNSSGAGSVLVFSNPATSSGQNVLYNEINGTMRSKWRTDASGNVNWVANGGSHYFFTGGDYGSGNIRLAAASSGSVYLGGAIDPTTFAGAKMTVLNAGRVLINTTTDDGSNALQVNGSVSIALGNRLKVVEGTGGFTGQTTLVSGTKAITITGVTTASRAFCQLVSQGGTVTTTQVYAAVCTANTLTITALTNAGSTDTTDTSVLNYFIVN